MTNKKLNTKIIKSIRRHFCLDIPTARKVSKHWQIESWIAGDMIIGYLEGKGFTKELIDNGVCSLGHERYPNVVLTKGERKVVLEGDCCGFLSPPDLKELFMIKRRVQ